MTEVFMDADPTIFDNKMITSLIKGQRCGFMNADSADRLFALTMFELWHREYPGWNMRIMEA